ncbi:MAG TPA: hypothetical protein VIV11_31670 [Kofleriaceae bacterium]
MRVWLVLLVAACKFDHGTTGDGGSDGPVDGLVDMMPDGFDPKCFGKAPFTICLDDVPGSPLTVPADINTSDTGPANCPVIGGAVVSVGGVETCVLAGTDVTVSGSIIGVEGARPLVVVATGTLTVSTMNFDITSGLGGTGPNANPTDCAPVTTMNGGSGNGGGGGGAGGSFGSQGGNGGSGANATVDGGSAKPADITFDKLRGGCKGGVGGVGEATDTQGGSGGGVLYLVSRDSIMITGRINASGAGGNGGDGGRGGAGGGGSGGMIVLFAPNLSIGAGGRVFANGGGGGGGAGNTTVDGGRGGDGLEPETPALGGIAGEIQGTPGGNGAFKSTDAVSAAPAMQGGGGGGGGVGVIRILSGQTVAPINVSPTPILN